MFDLHCNNNDPWTWDYQWVYSCWKTNGLSIVPANNLVSNLGIGPDASNTIANRQVKEYPPITNPVNFPLKHPDLLRDTLFEKSYHLKRKSSFFRLAKNLLKFIFKTK
jgi:hypothetical protein